MHATPRRPRSYLSYSFSGIRRHAGLDPFFDSGAYYLEATVIGADGNGLHYTCHVDNTTGYRTSVAVTGTPLDVTFAGEITLAQMVAKCIDEMSSSTGEEFLSSFGDAKEKADWVDFRLSPLDVAVGDPSSDLIETPYSYVKVNFEAGIEVDWLDLKLQPAMALAPCKIDYNVVWGYFNGSDIHKTSTKGVAYGASTICAGDGSSPRMPLAIDSVTFSDSLVDDDGNSIAAPSTGWTWFSLAGVKVTVPF